ncbi:hypothetical protein CASFOL_031927 [Castilleja foliolosa]|uniref:FAR1 domain-containing protein n=1 Tax=Castilleja foliolosa TaxID=1961234 RepID=A0ABD3C1R7_9LAMI
MMEFEEGELGDLEFGEKSAEIGECLAVYSHSDEEGGDNNSGELINNTLLNDEDGGSSDNGESINTILLNDESDTTNVAGYLIGLKRKNCDDIYRLYCEHARQVGFSVRKTTTRWNEDKDDNNRKEVCMFF